jgi:ABC-2 type transport system permease protein
VTSTAVPALAYLWWRSSLNVVRMRLLRLKQPKYFFGALLAVGYFGFLFLMPLLARSGREARRRPDATPLMSAEDFALVITSVATVMLLLTIILLWLWRRPRMSLQFTEAEIAFLFPGPVRHSVLVHYALIRSQLVVLVSAMFTTLLSLAWSLSSPWWARFVGWWLLFSVVSLHVTASGFMLTRLLDRGITQWQRQLGVAALLALGVAILNVLDPGLRLPLPGEMAPPERFAAYVHGQIDDGPLYWLLTPLRVLAGPLVAPDLPAFVLALAPALVVYAAHYAWACASEVRDSETALANAQKRASLRAAIQQGKLASLRPPTMRREPFRLAPRGSPVIALLWKNLLSTRDYVSVRTALVFAGLLIAWNFGLQSVPGHRPVTIILSMLALAGGANLLLVGAQAARQDLRSDMENADLLKTWPLQGWQVVLGELLAPTVILTVLLWLCLLQIVLSFEPSPRQTWFTPELRVAGGLAVALLLPFLCAAQLLIANTAVVLFPAWVKAAPGQQTMGVEVIGQRMLFMIGQWLFMFLALVPALLVGVVVYIPASWFIEAGALLPAAGAMALVLAAELAYGISWLGDRFDAYDLSAQ